jgi:hypothetical protein
LYAICSSEQRGLLLKRTSREKSEASCTNHSDSPARDYVCDDDSQDAEINSLGFCIHYVHNNANVFIRVVGIVTGYGLDDRGVGVRVSVGSRMFSSPRRPHRLSGSTNLLSNGYWGLFPPGVKRPGREVDHSPATSAEVKQIWLYTSIPPLA